MKLVRRGWQLRYAPGVVLQHRPSLANAGSLRHVGLRNTVVNAWLHRPLRSALRWTVFSLADAPKNRDFVRGLALILRAVPWILRERAPMPAALDADLRLLDERRFRVRRRFLTFREDLGRSAYPRCDLTPGAAAPGLIGLRGSPSVMAFQVTEGPERPHGHRLPDERPIDRRMQRLVGKLRSPARTSGGARRVARHHGSAGAAAGRPGRPVGDEPGARLRRGELPRLRPAHRQGRGHHRRRQRHRPRRRRSPTRGRAPTC